MLLLHVPSLAIVCIIAFNKYPVAVSTWIKKWHRSSQQHSLNFSHIIDHMIRLHNWAWHRSFKGRYLALNVQKMDEGSNIQTFFPALLLTTINILKRVGVCNNWCFSTTFLYMTASLLNFLTTRKSTQLANPIISDGSCRDNKCAHCHRLLRFPTLAFVRFCS